jgi:hypothetical protein
MIFRRAARRAATSGERVCVRGKVYAVIIWFELYKLVGESQPRKKHATLLLQQRYNSPIYAPTYLYRYHLLILTLLSSQLLCTLIACGV